MPALDIILIARTSPALRRQALTALAVARAGHDTSLIIIGPHLPDAAADDGNTWLPAPPDADIPRQRLIALEHGVAPLVAFLEDDCLVAPTWCAALLATDATAVGGPILPDTYDHARDWALFFCEYGRFLPPFAGDVPVLPGNNVAYRRRALTPLLTPDGLYDLPLQRQLAQAGQTLVATPDAAVTVTRRWTPADLGRMPLDHGRLYGAQHANGRAWSARLPTLLLAPGLPLLQVGRMITVIGRRPAYIRPFLRALPAIFRFYTAWAAGEWLGAALGAGRSAGSWR